MTTRVLFLCTGNSARSQMAEAFLRKYGAEAFEVYSAGIQPEGINPLTVKVMKEIGMNLADQHSKRVGEYMGKMHFGYLITVCDDAERNCPRVFPGVGRHLHWSFEDPAAFQGDEKARLNKFRQVRDQIHDRIRAWVAEKQDADR